MPQYWLIKTEPTTYGLGDLERDGRTTWDGIRNAQALIHLRGMRPGDDLLVYHSGAERAVVGRARVEGEPLTEGKVTVVDVRFVARLPAPVPLAAIRADAALTGLPLLRNTRLSVMPITPDEWEGSLRLARRQT